VRERDGKLVYPIKPRDGEPFERTRPLGGGRPMQPKGTKLTLWWPLGVHSKLAVLCEGEPDALAVLSVLTNSNGDQTARQLLEFTSRPSPATAASDGTPSSSRSAGQVAAVGRLASTAGPLAARGRKVGGGAT
jgi:hypothetical protein